jgi:ribosomal protein L24
MPLIEAAKMQKPLPSEKAPVKGGDHCLVIAGTHKGKSGTVRDLNVSKTGHLTITVVQKNGERFKTLARNVEIRTNHGT